jgi:hypothetical protein
VSLRKQYGEKGRQAWYHNESVLAQHPVGRCRHVALLQVLVPFGRERASTLFHLKLRYAESKVMPTKVDQHILSDGKYMTLEHVGYMFAQCLSIDRVLNLHTNASYKIAILRIIEADLFLHCKINFHTHSSEVNIIRWWKPDRHRKWLIQSKCECLSLYQIKGYTSRRNGWFWPSHEIHGFDLNVTVLFNAEFCKVCDAR